MTTRSGWCRSAPGAKPDAAHDECARRLREGLLDGCSCENHADAGEDS